MTTVAGTPEHLDQFAWEVRGMVVDTDPTTYDDALAAFLSAPDNDLGTGGVSSLAPDVTNELGEVERIAVAAQAFAGALWAADTDAAVGTVTFDLPAAVWSALRRELGALDVDDLLAAADTTIAQRRQDEQAAQDALEAIRDHLDGGWNGVRQGELDSIREQFEQLSPAALDLTIAGMSDDELAHLFDELQDRWFQGGLDDGEREAFHLTVGMRASPTTWRRYASFTDELDPPVVGDLADSARTDPAHVGGTGVPWVLQSTDLLVGGFQPRDVNQGSIGDCYLIAAMQALAMHAPDELADIIAPTGNGLYVVTFADGHREVVGPHLPVAPNGSPVFGRPGSGDRTPELWGPLIEKAYAQRNGGWESIVGGSQAGAINDLTGRGDGWIDAGDVTVDDLAARFDAGEILGLSTIDPPPQGDMTDDEYRDFKIDWLQEDAPTPFHREVGGASVGAYERLHPDHAFIVKSVDADAGTVTVVNPWNPEGGEVVLTQDELRDSINGVRTNDAP